MESRRQRRLRIRSNKKAATRRLSKLLNPRKGLACVVLAACLLASSLAAQDAPEAEALTIPAGQRVLSTAYGLYGTPYVFNGYWWTGGAGIDCSELTMLAYRAAGVSLPDDPAAQMQYGRWVSTPRAGDLVFFSEDYSGYPTHVGIATGRGTVLHASTYTGNVTETWIGYIDGYMGAKRI